VRGGEKKGEKEGLIRRESFILSPLYFSFLGEGEKKKREGRRKKILSIHHHHFFSLSERRRGEKRGKRKGRKNGGKAATGSYCNHNPFFT